MKRHKLNIGPTLTKALKAQLELEIKNFNKDKTLQEIERNAVGRADKDAYEDWMEQHPGAEDPRANPDVLSEDEAMKFYPVDSDPDVEQAKTELMDLLSPREKQVWKLAMRDGVSVSQAAEKLRISKQAVSQYIKTATAKIQKHYGK